MQKLHRLAVFTAAMTLLLAAVGGLVRASESGLGCPDWPTCHGRIVAPAHYHSIIEYSHRLTAAIVVISTLLLAAVALREHRRERRIRNLAVVTVPIVLSQALLGALVVALELEAESVVAHLLVAMALLAVLLALVIDTSSIIRRPSALLPRAAPGADGPAPTDPARFARSALFVALATLALMLLGSYVSGRNAGLAFPDWPLFDGRLLPNRGGLLPGLHFAHRVAAALVGVAVVWLARLARRTHQHPYLVRLTIAATAGFGLQILVGAGNVLTKLSTVTRTAHSAIGGLLWGLLFSAAYLAHRLLATAGPPSAAATGPVSPAPSMQVPPSTSPTLVEMNEIAAPIPGVGTASSAAQGVRIMEHLRTYVGLTKPRIIELLLVTTVPAMILAQRRIPSVWLVLAVLFGGTLAAGGANTINCYLDRDIDEKMRRTHGRPLPAGRVSPTNALRFGIILELVAFGWLWWTANLLSAALAVGATLFYVFVYTMWLKRTTTQNIVIGGAAGAVPVLVGWAAVTGGLSASAWIMFAIIFVWTPPHFWALAVRYRDDYANAEVPMLPVVAGVPAAARQILVYSIVLVAVTLALYPVASMGLVYLVTATVLGALFIWHAVRLVREPDTAAKLFTFSITYLGLLFAAIAIDAIVNT